MSASLPRTDTTPGLSRPITTADGAVVGVRKPGGRLPVEVLRHLLTVAERWGDGRLRMTDRADLEVHGLPLDGEGGLPIEIIDAVAATGLVPPTHELVRNVLCSPLPRLGRPDLHPMAAELDDELLDVPLLEELPDGFVWALDDGTGDVAAEPWDICYQAGGEDRGVVAVRSGGAWQVSRVDAVSTMVALAQEFQLAPGRAEPTTSPVTPDDPAADGILASGPVPIGTYGPDLLAGVPGGVLTGELVRALPPLAEVTLTPWHQLLVPGGAARLEPYADAGFFVTPAG